MYFQPIILLTDKNKSPDEHIRDYLEKEKITISPTNIETYRSDKNSMGIKSISKLSAEISTRNDETRIFVILEAEKMTEEAQNSLLKTLEEPNNDSLIILQVYNSQSLLETIRSRCIEIYQREIESKISNDIYTNFIKFNYIQRRKIIDEITKEDNSREVAFELILYIMNYAKESRPEISDRLIEIFRGIRQGSNLKLALENVSILLT